MFPTVLIPYLADNSQYRETNVPVTTATNSIGTGKLHRLLTQGYKIKFIKIYSDNLQ